MPNIFDEVRLSDCLTIRHGKNQHAVEVIDGKFPILGTGGEIGRTNTALYDKPSVLIGRKGTIDKPKYMTTPFWTVDTLFYTEIKANAIPKYIYYVFNTINWYEYNEASGVPSLSASTISNIKIKLPKLDEQLRIVKVLEKWDSYVDRLNEKIDLKINIKRGLMKGLLSGTRKLPESNSAWSTSKISDICEIRRGGSPRPIDSYITNAVDGLNWLRIGDIQVGDRYIYRTTEKIKKEGLKKTTLVHSGDFILSNSMSYGRPYIMKIDACIHDGWLALMNISKEINTSYLYYLLSSEIIQAKFKSISAGSGVQNLKKDTVADIEINLPNRKEQDSIAAILSALDDEIDALIEKKKLIVNQKQYLVGNLLTGKIRTPLDTTITKKEALHA